MENPKAASKIFLLYKINTELEQRPVQGQITYQDTGHFADYHERFGHEEEEDICCKCGHSRSRLHRFSCANARPYRSKLFSDTEKRPLHSLQNGAYFRGKSYTKQLVG